MALKLAENIRKLRKQRGLSQERLAEALGVTVGAVHKWEAKLSTPELTLITRMADLFDVSVDALLGYRMNDNSADAVLERIASRCRDLDPAALAEAEQALGRYPNTFRIVYAGAQAYLVFGVSRHDQAYLRRALELLERSRMLLAQNDSPAIGDNTICGDMSVALFQLGQWEKGLELLKKNNVGGIFSGQIGAYLAAFMRRPEEAAPYLSEALLGGMSALLTAAFGFVFVFRARGDWASALDITRYALDLMAGLKTESGTGYPDKILAEMRVLHAYAQLKAGRDRTAGESLREARTAAERFDSMPDYSTKTLRYADGGENGAVFDILGTTAADSIASILRLLDDPAFTGRWKEICRHEA